MGAAHLTTGIPAVAGNVIAIEKVRCAILWLMECAGAFVLIEQSPYEVVGLLAMAFFCSRVSPCARRWRHWSC
jgi:hypothetical protein